MNCLYHLHFRCCLKEKQILDRYKNTFFFAFESCIYNVLEIILFFWGKSYYFTHWKGREDMESYLSHIYMRVNQSNEFDWHSNSVLWFIIPSRSPSHSLHIPYGQYFPQPVVYFSDNRAAHWNHLLRWRTSKFLPWWYPN